MCEQGVRSGDGGLGDPPKLVELKELPFESIPWFERLDVLKKAQEVSSGGAGWPAWIRRRSIFGQALRTCVMMPCFFYAPQLTWWCQEQTMELP